MFNFLKPEQPSETTPLQSVDALVRWRERLLRTVMMGTQSAFRLGQSIENTENR